MIRFRFGLNFYKEAHQLSLGDFLHQASIEWHGVKLGQPNWGQESRQLAFLVRGRNRQGYIILNAFWEPATFELPPASDGYGKGWRRIIDTFRPSPDDICDLATAPLVRRRTYLAQPRSVVMLLSEKV
jgi:glycogen operon protein